MSRYIKSMIVSAGVEAMARSLRRSMQIAGVMQKQKVQKFYKKPSQQGHEERRALLFKLKKLHMSEKKGK